MCQNGKFLKVAACGTYTAALNSYVPKTVNLPVHDPYELSSLNIENNSFSVMKIVLGKESRFVPRCIQDAFIETVSGMLNF